MSTKKIDAVGFCFVKNFLKYTQKADLMPAFCD